MKKFTLLLLAVATTLTAAFTLNTDGEHEEHFKRLFGEHDIATGFVILPHADASYLKETPYETLSFLGMANVDFPTFINGELIENITENGFFAVHMPLSMGRNTFIFENGEYSREVLVRRVSPERGGTAARRTDFSRAVYGRAESGNISRFYNGNDNNHGTPLARDTFFRIVAEQGDYYILQDDSYVFISRVERVPADDIPTDFLPLYTVDIQDNHASVTWFEFDGEVKDVSEFEFDRPISGHYIKDGEVAFTLMPAKLSEARVLIDAGHGGTDPGALGPAGRYGAMEKDFNLAVATMTVDFLRERGLQVDFMRDTGDFIPLLERMEVFEETPYDLVLSVHSNSMSVNRDFNSSSGPLMYYTLSQSQNAANTILAPIAAATGHEFTPAIKRNFAMARHTAGVSMLFEMGFMCNPADYEQMLAPDYLELLAASLAQGIVDYFSEGVIEAEPTPPEKPEKPATTPQDGSRPERPTKPEPITADKQDNTANFVIVAMLSCLVMYRIPLKIKKRGKKQ